ncbi:hypothetical protein, partial [Reyranella sp.]|uniref:hypothetical protein n=1 Tax=Reyranella sp. TaxID=1929291 RepID=UPI00272FC6D3
MLVRSGSSLNSPTLPQGDGGFASVAAPRSEKGGRKRMTVNGQEMTSLTSDLLKELSAADHGPCLSLYQP